MADECIMVVARGMMKTRGAAMTAMTAMPQSFLENCGCLCDG
jgi:hypothetical protein